MYYSKYIYKIYKHFVHSLVYFRSYHTFSNKIISYLHHVNIHMFHALHLLITRLV